MIDDIENLKEKDYRRHLNIFSIISTFVAVLILINGIYNDKISEEIFQFFVSISTIITATIVNKKKFQNAIYIYTLGLLCTIVIAV